MQKKGGGGIKAIPINQKKKIRQDHSLVRL